MNVNSGRFVHRYENKINKQAISVELKKFYQNVNIIPAIWWVITENLKLQTIAWVLFPGVGYWKEIEWKQIVISACDNNNNPFGEKKCWFNLFFIINHCV